MSTCIVCGGQTRNGRAVEAAADEKDRIIASLRSLVALQAEQRRTEAAAARAYLDAEAQPAYSWVIESREARRENRPNREVERMNRIARARVVLEEALLATPEQEPT